MPWPWLPQEAEGAAVIEMVKMDCLPSIAALPNIVQNLIPLSELKVHEVGLKRYM